MDHNHFEFWISSVRVFTQMIKHGWYGNNLQILYHKITEENFCKQIINEINSHELRNEPCGEKKLILVWISSIFTRKYAIYNLQRSYNNGLGFWYFGSSEPSNLISSIQGRMLFYFLLWLQWMFVKLCEL